MKKDQPVGRIACRDCGHLLETNARGCPGCAMNLEAERMIELFIWRRFLPAAVIIVVLGAAALYLLR